MKKICFILMSFVGLANAGCLNDVQMRALENKERDYLLSRVPPAFEDALASGGLKMVMQNSAEKTCAVQLNVTLPEQDLVEARKVLAEQPAKQIMLAAQGYGLPETTGLSADFELDLTSLSPQKGDTLQTAPLGKVRATIELMYAMLTQARAELQGTVNTEKWVQPFKDQQIRNCTNQYSQATQACVCWADNLEGKVSAKQMRYQAYLASNPYALATGASKTYTDLNQESAKNCGLIGKVNS